MFKRYSHDLIPWSYSDQSLASDSAVLRETDVFEALERREKKAERRDVLDGIRNGLLISVGIWAAMLAFSFFLIR